MTFSAFAFISITTVEQTSTILAHRNQINLVSSGIIGNILKLELLENVATAQKKYSNKVPTNIFAEMKRDKHKHKLATF